MNPRATLLTNLGQAVRNGRKARGWSRKELAGQSGVSERFLAEIETGRGNPSLLRVLDLANSLETTPADLLRTAASTPTGERQVIALLGLRGAGKSSVGKRLAETIGWQFVELDVLIEQQSGLRLSEMFELHGRPHYRRMERQALESVLETGEPVVLSTGGGLVTEAETFALLKQNAQTVWLKARPEDHWGRVVAQGDTRPMQGNDEAFAHLCTILEERERLYEQAQVIVETSGKSFEDTCAELAERFSGVA